MVAALALDASAQESKPTKAENLKEAPLVTTGCSVVGIFYASSGLFTGCTHGTNGFGAGLFAGVYHPLPPVERFGLDGDGYLMIRWTAGPLGFELYGGAGANAETKSASARVLWLIGTTPKPAGLTLIGVHDYYPESWNFGDSNANVGQYDTEFRVGPSFLIPGSAKVSVIPFVGMGFADSRHLNDWRARTGFMIAIPL
ncbi:MAG: hypothetical protein WCT54_04875 [Patescibacteria group bacterium]